MRIRRLELIGFKSFPERTVLTLGPGMTGVVGPNGCGKSNLADAMRWVLGESSARSMRGSEMGDVIFAGSTTHPAMSAAEVRLAFSADGGEPFPGAYAALNEVEVARRLHRNGGSEYEINQVRVRRRDVVEFLLDAGIGSEFHAFVEQGRVDRLVHATPQERRAILDDVAGVAAWRIRRTEAMGRLAATGAQLDRVSDVVDELDRQVRGLAESAVAATRWRRARARIRLAEIAVSMVRYEERAADRRALRERLREWIAKSDAAERELARRGKERAQRTEELAVIEAAETTWRDELAEIDAALSALTATEAGHRDRAEAAAARAVGCEEDVTEATARVAARERELEEATAEGEGAAADGVAAERRWRQADEARVAAEGRVSTDAALEVGARAALAEADQRVTEARSAEREADVARERWPAEWTQALWSLERAEADRQAAESRVVVASSAVAAATEVRASAGAASKRQADVREELRARWAVSEAQRRRAEAEHIQAVQAAADRARAHLAAREAAVNAWDRERERRFGEVESLRRRALADLERAAAHERDGIAAAAARRREARLQEAADAAARHRQKVAGAASAEASARTVFDAADRHLRDLRGAVDALRTEVAALSGARGGDVARIAEREQRGFVSLREAARAAGRPLGAAWAWADLPWIPRSELPWWQAIVGPDEWVECVVGDGLEEVLLRAGPEGERDATGVTHLGRPRTLDRLDALADAEGRLADAERALALATGAAEDALRGLELARAAVALAMAEPPPIFAEPDGDDDEAAWSRVEVELAGGRQRVEAEARRARDDIAREARLDLTTAEEEVRPDRSEVDRHAAASREIAAAVDVADLEWRQAFAVAVRAEEGLAAAVAELQRTEAVLSATLVAVDDAARSRDALEDGGTRVARWQEAADDLAAALAEQQRLQASADAAQRAADDARAASIAAQGSALAASADQERAAARTSAARRWLDRAQASLSEAKADRDAALLRRGTAAEEAEQEASHAGRVASERAERAEARLASRDRWVRDRDRAQRLRASIQAIDVAVVGARAELDAVAEGRRDVEDKLRLAQGEVELLRRTMEDRYQANLPGLVDRLQGAPVVLEPDEGDTEVADFENGVVIPPVPALRITSLRDESAIAGWVADLESARREVAGIGEVHVGAAAAWADGRRRLIDMIAQKADLEASVADLRAAIARLNRTSRERFREAFDRIDEAFREVYPRLVGGGSARLALDDQDDVLDAGVELHVQAPGKRPQHLGLLSGGEKAMAAIALLMAMFRYRPAPFCIFDEVDAPLDEANGSRFVELLRELAGQTQFVIVTHHRRTMEAADALMGVTMGRPGVSQVVGVRLG